MESLDQQFQQLKENYEHMAEGQLCALAEEAYDLTEIAREALQAVISEKGIPVRLRVEPPPSSRSSHAKPPEDDLVLFGWAKSAEEAGRTMKILAAAGIPSFLSLEVQMDDLKRAYDALDCAYEEDAEDDPEKTEYAILCPKCRSAKVVLDGPDIDDLAKSPPRNKLQWSCDACGHQWVDDGIAQKVVGGQSWPGEEFSSRRGPFRSLDPKSTSEH